MSPRPIRPGTCRSGRQDRLFLGFYGDDLTHRFTRAVPHDEQQWQRLDEIAAEAEACWLGMPDGEFDFVRAKSSLCSEYTK
jgi:hypothetical protein